MKRAEQDQAESSEESARRKASRMDAAGVQRYLVGVEYLGTRFSGSQKQEGFRTVQRTLEEAFAKFVGHSVSAAGSSRTDTGVHALRNTFHVDIVRTSKRKPGEVLTPHAPDVIVRAVNHFLHKDAPDVRLLDAKSVPSDFHARFKAKERMYHYRILAGNEPVSVFEKERVWHVEQSLDLKAMQEACQILVGTHDFSSFRATGCQANSPIKTLDEFNVSEAISWPHFLNGQPPSKFKSYVVTARAQSFLYHQIRLMVGTLKAVGARKLAVEDVRRILEGCSVSMAFPMAPACGLFLADVKYDLEEHL